jgi:hypothetical protein
MASWPPTTRCIYAALQLLLLEHSDERVLQDVLASLHLLLAASNGSEAVIAVCCAGGPASNNKTYVSLWDLVSRLTVLSLHPSHFLACDALVALSLLTCNAAGAAVCVLNRAACLLLWQVMCRCLDVVSTGSKAATADAENTAESVEEFSGTMPHIGSVAPADADITSFAGDISALDYASSAEASNAQAEAGVEGSQESESASAASEQLPAESQQPPKAFARRSFMSEEIHGRYEHSFAAGCSLTSEAYLLQPGVVELLLYCTMHACINCCTVSVSMRRTRSKEADAPSVTTLQSCSFGCNVCVQSAVSQPPRPFHTFVTADILSGPLESLPLMLKCALFSRRLCSIAATAKTSSEVASHWHSPPCILFAVL